MANAPIESTDERLPLRPDPWRIAWNALASDALLAFALLALALLMALSGWLPQAPDSVSDPMAFSRWLGETQAHFGSFALLRQAGLFSLEQSPALRALLALATLCLLVRLVESVQAAWSARRFFPNAGRIAIYLGATLVITGLAISSAAGWRASNLTLGVGQMTLIGHGTPYSLRLDALDAANKQVALLRETDVIGQGDVALERPMRAADLAIFLSGEGPAIRASATLTDGQPVDLQAAATSTPATELLLLLTRDEPDRFFAAPQAGLVVQLSRGAGGSSSILAQVYRLPAGATIFEGEIPADGRLSVENTVFTLSAENYAVLDVARDPGTPLTLAGMVVLALGLALAALWPVNQPEAPAALSETPPPLTRQERLSRLIKSAWWKVGLAILSVTMSIVVAHSLARAGTLWPPASAAPALVAAWLAGCAAAVMPRRATGWATLALAVIALAAWAIWPGILLPSP
jgi:hypothetical protein